MFTVTLPTAYLLSNLGIAMRQKTMAFPFFISSFLYLVSSKNKYFINKKEQELDSIKIVNPKMSINTIK